MADGPMPPGFPRASDFSAAEVGTHKIEWHYRREHNQGGSNFGTDFIAPNDSVVVDYDIHIISDIHTKGSPNIHLVMKSVGVLQEPVGVHVGHRLNNSAHERQ